MLLKDQLQIFEVLHSQTGDLEQSYGYGSESYVSLTNIISWTSPVILHSFWLASVQI